MNFNLISFGETLRNIRGELNLNLDDVSKLSGVNSETIRRIELGKVIPKFDRDEFDTLYIELEELNTCIKYLHFTI